MRVIDYTGANALLNDIKSRVTNFTPRERIVIDLKGGEQVEIYHSPKGNRKRMSFKQGRSFVGTVIVTLPTGKKRYYSYLRHLLADLPLFLTSKAEV